MKTEVVRQRIFQLSFMGSLDQPLKTRLAELFMGIGDGRRVPAGTRLFTEGSDASDEGIIILDGDIRVTRPDAPEVVASAPQLIGEMAQFNPAKRRTATVTADTELAVLVFKWAEYNAKGRAYLEAGDVESVNAALQEYAWQHFTE